MIKVTYEVVEHDGGWAYRVNGLYLETFPTHALAHKAAERAARERVAPVETTGIFFEELKSAIGIDEVSAGSDRPETDRPDSSVVALNLSPTFARISTPPQATPLDADTAYATGLNDVSEEPQCLVSLACDFASSR